MPLSTVCGTTIALNSSPTFSGMVPATVGSPTALTSPVLRSMTDLRVVFVTTTCFCAADHSPSVNPRPLFRRTFTQAILCLKPSLMAEDVGAMSEAFPQRKSLASYPPGLPYSAAFLWSLSSSNE